MRGIKGTNTIYGRPADSQRHIVQELRSQIVSGHLVPGSRLPTRLELERHYNAGATTVQRALELLQQEGFVQSRGRNGTFVVDNPPHLARYAIVFPTPMEAFTNNRFSSALDSEVRRLRRQRPDLNIAEYFGVDGHEDSEDYQQLVREIHSHRVAGLIFTSNPFLVNGTPLVDEPSIPRVGIMPQDPLQRFPVVYPNMASFFARALDDLQARGRKKIAFLNPVGLCDRRKQFATMLQERGLETRPYWWQCTSPDFAEAAQYATQLLMHCVERPDALIISNDNLLEYATTGLVAAGVRVPEDIEVIAHCNFPYPTPSVLPVRRLGFDARRVFGACIENIDHQRAGHVVPEITNIDAEFEEELSQRAV